MPASPGAVEPPYMQLCLRGTHLLHKHSALTHHAIAPGIENDYLRLHKVLRLATLKCVRMAAGATTAGATDNQQR